MKYILTITPEAAEIVAEALDLYAHVGIGAFGEILRVFRDPNVDIPVASLKTCEKHLCDTKMILTGLPGDAHHGISSASVQVKFKEAFNVLQVLNHTRAKVDGDKLSIWNHDPLPVGVNTELPDIEVVNERDWTVIGYYCDNNQRWAENFKADSAGDAEIQALQDAGALGSDLIVVGVVHGDIHMQDYFHTTSGVDIIEVEWHTVEHEEETSL